VVEKKKSGLDIKVWTVTDAPKARDEVPPARLEYSKLWADDWGRELSSKPFQMPFLLFDSLHISAHSALLFPEPGLFLE
jgi:hypothetical protein